MRYCAFRTRESCLRAAPLEFRGGRTWARSWFSCAWRRARSARNALSIAAAERGLTVSRLDLRKSGDTAGDKGSVVGYGAWAWCSGA
jgi:hypothetical protein